jgi:hypothetical protein
VSTLRYWGQPQEEQAPAPQVGSGYAARAAVQRALRRAELAEREDEELVLAALALMD